MKVITTNEAIEKIGIERFSSDIAYMSKETYNLWYENYYSYNLDEFPNWQKLHEYNMNKCTNIDSSFVIVHDNHLIGYIIFEELLTNNNKELWMNDLFVWPEWRSKGIATMLIKHVIDITKTMCKKIYLSCEKKLINFYLNKGWKPIKINTLNTFFSDYWTIMFYNQD